MFPVSDTFKAAMKAPMKELRAKITYGDTVISDDTDLVSFKVSCETGMCKTAMRKLEAQLIGDYNLLDTWIIPSFGVVLPDKTVEYLSYGSFKVTEIKYAKDTGKTSVVAYDKMINAMKAYDPLSVTYPIGLYNYTKQLLLACDLELSNTSFPILNNWQVTEDLFKNISGITYRDILVQIAQATGTTCIISQDKVLFKSLTDTGETLTYDNMMSLSLEPVYGEINSVVLSRIPQEDNVYLKDDASIAANGLTEFKIENNEFLDKNREAAIQDIYNKLHGISYYPFNTSTEGLGWYEIGDSFDIINDSGDVFNTSLFIYSVSIDGGIKEKLQTKAETKTQTQYQYATSIEKKVKNTEIVVDKQGQKIESLVEDVEGLDKSFTKVEQTVNSLSSTVSEVKTEAVVSSVTEYYSSTSTSALVGGKWVTTQPEWQEGRYIWSRLKTTNGNGNVSYSAAACISGNTGAKGDTGARGPQGEQGIQGEKGDTGAQGPQGEQGIQGEKGDTGARGPQGEQGIQGEKGDPGNGINSTTVSYGVSDSPSVKPTSWQDSIPTVAAGKYLWTRTIIDYTDPAVQDTVTFTYAKQGSTGAKGDKGDTGPQGPQGEQGIQGEKGDTGTSGTSVTVKSIQYQQGTSPTAAPTGTWSNNVVAVDEGKYLWTKTTFSDNTVAYGVAKQGEKGSKGDTGAQGPQGEQGIQGEKGDTGARGPQGEQGIQGEKGDTGARGPQGEQGIQGEKGDTGARGPQGEQGIQGEKGDTGATGKGVSTITKQFAISSSKTSAPTSGWSNTQPEWQEGKYLWTRDKIVYSNPTSTEYTTPAVSSEWEAVNNIQVGGKNLLKPATTGGSSNIVSRGDYEITFNETGDNKDTHTYLNMYEAIEDGQEYTLSFMVSGMPSGASWGFYISAIANGIFMPITADGKYIKTFTFSASDAGKDTFIIDDGTRTNLSGNITLFHFQLEKGNKATDWAVAPEYLIEKNNELTNRLDEDYATKDSVTAIETSIKSVIEQTNAAVNIRFQETTDSIDANGQKIDQLHNEVESMIRLTSDGVAIGKSDSQCVLKAKNDAIVFEINGLEKGKFTPTSFSLIDLSEFNLGPFTYKMQDNGSLSLL